MPGRCKQCRSTILFGSVRSDGMTFCSEGCRDEFRVERQLQTSYEVSDRTVAGLVADLQAGKCASCGGRGPIDAHPVGIIYSFVFITVWNNDVRICCRNCATRTQVKATLISACFGWPGLTGFIMTPGYIYRNIQAMMSPADTSESRAHLEYHVRMNVAERLDKGLSIPVPRHTPSSTRRKTSDEPATSVACDCPECGRELRLKAKFAGKRIRCPDCQSPVTVPDLAAEFHEDDAWEDEVAPRRLSQAAEENGVASDARARVTGIVLAVVICLVPTLLFGAAFVAAGRQVAQQQANNDRQGSEDFQRLQKKVAQDQKASFQRLNDSSPLAGRGPLDASNIPLPGALPKAGSSPPSTTSPLHPSSGPSIPRGPSFPTGPRFPGGPPSMRPGGGSPFSSRPGRGANRVEPPRGIPGP